MRFITSLLISFTLTMVISLILLMVACYNNHTNYYDRVIINELLNSNDKCWSNIIEDPKGGSFFYGIDCNGSIILEHQGEGVGINIESDECPPYICSRDGGICIDPCPTDSDDTSERTIIWVDD